MSSKSLAILIVVSLILIIAAGFGGYSYGKTQNSPQILPLTAVSSQTPVSDSNTLPLDFANQVTFQGKVIQLTGSEAVVTSLNNQTKTFVISKTVNIIDASIPPKPGTVSVNPTLTTIPLNKSAAITLVLINNQYQITNVMITPQIATPAPANLTK